jgi:phosphomannomutase
LKHKLFGSSEVRGLTNVELRPTLAAQVTLAVATYMRAKKDAIKDVAMSFRDVFPSHKSFSEVDGFRLVLEDGWVSVRASGTEPLIRLTVEGESLKGAKQIMEESESIVRRHVRRKHE